MSDPAVPAAPPAASPVPPPAATVHVIPREEHSISRQSISPSALRVLYRLHEAGHQACLVGGAVRDLLAGITPKDFDVATDATPDEVRHLFRNARLIGRRFRLAHVMFGREIIEVATFRANQDDGSGARRVHDDGRVLRDNVYGTIEDDAIRRDFTANALYYAVDDFSIRDYVGGFADVRQRVLRLIGDAETRYREDPVRMLRAVRLSAKLGFSIADETAGPIPQLAGLLTEAAPARLFEEVLKLFQSGHAVASFELLERFGLVAALFPETAAALASNRSGVLRTLIVEGLRNTDARIAAGLPVSPGFLFAVLLWPAYCRHLAGLQAQGMPETEARQRAADRVTLHQLETIALPRRFSLPMQDIWQMQARFALRQRKRVLRTLAHPRFRAAWDFLLLREHASGAHGEDVAFWRSAQADPELISLAASTPPEADPEDRTELPFVFARERMPRRRNRWRRG